MSVLFNRVRVNTATVGTGTMTLGAAVSAAFFTAAEAGIPDGTVVSYVIEDGTNVEMGIGTYTVSGTTLSRTTVTASKIGGTAGTTKLTLSGSAVVFIDALAADITVPPASSTDKAIARYSGTTGKAVQNSAWTISDIGFLSATVNDNSAQSISLSNTNSGGSAAATLELSCGPASLAFRSFGVGVNYAIVLGHLAFGVFDTNNFGLFTANVNRLYLDGTTGFVGVGATAVAEVADRQFHVEQDSATTNAVTYVERITSTSSGTPAVGIGVGMEFEVETAAGVNKVGATVENYAYNVGTGTESFELVFKTMLAGAAATEEMRAGFAPVQQVQQDSIVMRANYGIVVPEYYEIASGVSLELGAGAIMEITA